MSLKIWHNPRCSKSRQTLAILEDKGLTPEVRLYLEDGPSAEEIRAALKSLGLAASDIVRKGEADYKQLGLSSASDDETLIAAMSKTPNLIERPIVFSQNKAKIGRPPESVLEIL
ncbi:MAG: arsenate reductase (glutaredoxin) [Kordiimonadaceae bacterium]|nr:arsenate reductase (glutaredoxin) [Kordiimonadaceae bacterium]